MLAVASLILFIIAALLRLLGSHFSTMIWLIIAGGILLSAHAIWGWGTGRWWGARP